MIEIIGCSNIDENDRILSVFKFKQHTDRPNSPQSLDGFTKPKSRDGFKSLNRQTNIDFKPNSKRLNSDDPGTFPGLKSTFAQPSSHATIEEQFEYESKVAKIKSKKSWLPNLRMPSRKVSKRLALGLLAVILVGGGWLGLKGYLTVRKVFQDDGFSAPALNKEIDPSQLVSEGDGRVNVLLLGKGGEGHDGGELTDSMIIASIDPFAKTAALLSIPRDLYVKVPNFWGMKINAAYSTSKQRAFDEGESGQQAETAGITTLKDTIKEYIGIPIHYHVMVDFAAFETGVDAVGGIDINIEESLYDTWAGEAPLNIKPGQQVFNGYTALRYARSRYTSPRGDFDRSERQRAILVALRQKVLSLGTFANPFAISSLLDVVGDNVKTNMSLDEMLQIYELTKDIDSSLVKSLSFVDDPILLTTSYVGNQSVVIPTAGINDYSEIRSFTRNQLRDGFLERENASVMVLNGSGITGLATTRAKELESYGYNVIEIGDAPTADYKDTVLVDNTDGQKAYTQSYLQKRLKVTAVNKPPKEGFEQFKADFVIIVGANEKITF